MKGKREEIMKKIPFLLLMLTLGVVIATSIEAKAAEIETMTEQIMSVTGAREAEKENRDILDLTPNQYNGWVNVATLSPYSSRITVRATAGTVTDWQVGKILLVYRDYENGITERTADDRLATLGVEDSSDWAVTLGENDGHGMYVVDVDVAAPDDGIMKNLTNVLYYAVQFGHEYQDENGQWQMNDEWWVRGKVDYRACAHSEVFQKNLMTCNAKYDEVDYKTNTGTVKYLPYLYQRGEFAELPENEVIPTWDREWTEILQKRYGDITGELNVLEHYLRDTDDAFDEFEERLEKLLKALSGMTTLGGYVTGVENLQGSLAKLRQDYLAKNSEGDTGMINTLQARITELEAANGELLTDKADLQAKNVELDTSVTNLETEKQILEKEKQDLGLQNENLARQVEELKQQLEQREKCLVSSGGVASDGQSDNTVAREPITQNPIVPEEPTEEVVVKPAEREVVVGQVTVNQRATSERSSVTDNTGEALVANDVVADGEEMQVETPEVPALGGKTALKHVWWFTIPFVVLLGCLILWLKRLANKREYK